MTPASPPFPVPVDDLSIDINHSSLEFAVQYLKTAKVRGRLDQFGGRLAGAADVHDFTGAKLTFEGQMNSLNTNQEMRDSHLKSPEWFDTARFLTSRFESTAITRTGPDAYDIAGQFTLKAQTHPLTLHAHFHGTGRGNQGEGRVGFSFQATLNRQDYGVAMGEQDKGGFFVSDEVELTGEISLLAAETPAP